MTKKVVMMLFFLVQTTSEIYCRCAVVLRLADVAMRFQPHIHVETMLCAQWEYMSVYPDCETTHNYRAPGGANQVECQKRSFTKNTSNLTDFFG